MDGIEAENQKYKEIQKAMYKEDEIMKEVEELLATSPRAEAEKIIAEKYAPLLEKISKITRQTTDELRGITAETEKEEN